jgi:hypothetical protein
MFITEGDDKRTVGAACPSPPRPGIDMSAPRYGRCEYWTRCEGSMRFRVVAVTLVQGFSALCFINFLGLDASLNAGRTCPCDKLLNCNLAIDIPVVLIH